jgi:hypothetical protein
MSEPVNDEIEVKDDFGPKHTMELLNALEQRQSLNVIDESKDTNLQRHLRNVWHDNFNESEFITEMEYYITSQTKKAELKGRIEELEYVQDKNTFTSWHKQVPIGYSCKTVGERIIQLKSELELEGK